MNFLPLSFSPKSSSRSYTSETRDTNPSTLYDSQQIFLVANIDAFRLADCIYKVMNRPTSTRTDRRLIPKRPLLLCLLR